MLKVIGSIFAAILLIVALRILGAAPSLRSPLLLAELCGLLAVVASFIALCGTEDRTERGVDAAQTMSSAQRATQPPRWQSM